MMGGGIGLGLGRLRLGARGVKLSLVQDAINIIRRLGGTLIGIPDNFAGSYIDSTGTTPVTAVGDLVGLLTDRSYGAGNLGGELVTNGDFSAGTAGWNATSATISTVGGELSVLASSTAQPSAAQAISTVSGKTYKISARLRADAANTAAKSARVRVAETASGGLIYSGPYEVTSNGVARELTAFFTAPIATAYVLLEVGSSSAYGNVGDKAYFDNISVREVLGNHATQPTTASKPVVAVNAQGKKVISFDGSNDFLQTGITTGNEGWICAGFKQNSAVTVYPVASGGLTDTQAGICLRLTSGITPLVTASDGTLRQLVVADSSIAIGEAVVQSCGWNSTTLMLGVNNTEKSEARTRNPTSSTITTIGGADGTGSGTVNGQITAVVRCPVLPSAADRDLIRKWIGSLQGQTL